MEEVRHHEPDSGVGAHAVLSGGAEIFLPLEGVIDLERERERLGEEIRRNREQLESARKKLDNEQFVNRAPDEVVQRERDKADSFREQIEKLEEKLQALAGGEAS